MARCPHLEYKGGDYSFWNSTEADYQCTAGGGHMDLFSSQVTSTCDAYGENYKNCPHYR